MTSINRELFRQGSLLRYAEAEFLGLALHERKADGPLGKDRILVLITTVHFMAQVVPIVITLSQCCDEIVHYVTYVLPAYNILTSQNSGW